MRLIAQYQTRRPIRTEQECLEAIQVVIETWQLPEGMIIVGSTCYNWGAQS
jgi:hypothetical protein